MKTTQKTKKQRQPSLKKPETGKKQTFIEHVYELRSRLFWIVATLLVASAIGFQLKDFLVSFIMMPLHGEKLVYLTPGGGFSFIFTLCLYFGALLTIPVVIYHIYRFLQPVIGATSRRLLVILMSLSAVLAVSGVAFGYFVAIPAAINFLTGFAGDAVTANLTAESYLAFVMAYMFGLAALFQLPLILFMADHIRRFPPGTLLSMQRFVIVGAVIAAAIITPTPDIVNQMIIAVPIIGVYQLGVVVIWLRHRRERPQLASAVVTPELVTDQREEQGVPRITPVATPLPARDIQPTPSHSLAAHRRSIDGFVHSSTSSAQERAVRVSVTEDRPRNRLRSLDGFLIVQKASS